MNLYQVFHKEYRGDDPFEVEALDHEDAAELYAQYSDSDGEYSIVGGNNIEVTVLGENIEKKFRVSGEAVPRYSAREIK